MPTSLIVSVNVGSVARMDIDGEPGETAIDKRSVRGRVFAGKLGLAGDNQADKENHGGPEQAIYAYAREDMDWWTEQAGREFSNGEFGENLTTTGLDITGAFIGEVWQIGADVVVQVTSPRIPCQVFGAWTGEHHWVKRFAAARRPGAYLRVLAEGEIGARDRIEVLSRPDQRVTIAESMSAYYGDAELMRVLLTVEGRGAKWDAIGEHVLGRARIGTARV
ncbi:MAG TPA: MOSC domain-containing protein [Streptosporangiaceae bacterium]|nr:MOSC domain-containing protein [Streptosporangiaceae bacterium]